jgi:hypothetical protein
VNWRPALPYRRWMSTSPSLLPQMPSVARHDVPTAHALIVVVVVINDRRFRPKHGAPPVQLEPTRAGAAHHPQLLPLVRAISCAGQPPCRHMALVSSNGGGGAIEFSPCDVTAPASAPAAHLGGRHDAQHDIMQQARRPFRQGRRLRRLRRFKRLRLQVNFVTRFYRK